MVESFFHLSGKPFQLNPDPDFFFASRGHSRAFSYLKYGIYQAEGFIVITGEIGAGKTTLVRALIDELDPEKIVSAQLSSTQLSPDELVNAVASAFGIPEHGRGKSQRLAQLGEFLKGLAAQGRRALLVVDEAQNLSPAAMEELRMLSNFQEGARSLLQSFMVGQPELRETLNAPWAEQMRQRIIASYHLGPLERGETGAYVRHRLERVGWKEDPQFDPAIFDRLYGATGGLPRLINSVCNRLMLDACLDERHLIGTADLTRVLGEMEEELGRPGPAGSGAKTARVNATDPAGIARPQAISALNARLDRIEKGINQAVDLLHQMQRTPATRVPAPAAPAAATPFLGPRDRVSSRTHRK